MEPTNTTASEGAVPRPDRILNVDPYCLNKFGLSRDGTELKIGDFDLYGVPVSLTERSGRFLFVLSPKEQRLFHDFVGTPVRLFLRTRAHCDEKADLKVILLNAKLESLDNFDHNENLCMIGLRYIHSPEAYLEKIRAFLFDSDYYLEKYGQLGDTKAERVPFDRLVPNLLKSQAGIRLPGGSKARAKILSINPREAEVYLETSPPELPVGTQTPVEFRFEGYSIVVRTTVSACRPAGEVPGFAFALLSLAYHPALAEALLPSMTAR